MKAKRKHRRAAFETLRDLEQGNLSAGERHLAEVLRAVQEGYPIPSATTMFLKGAIRRLFAGEEPVKAFDLNKDRRTKGVPASVYDQVARAVWGERYYGATYDEAVLVVGKRYGLTRNTVTSYCSKSKRTGGVPPQKRSEQPLYPVNPIERQEYLVGRLKKR